MLLLVLMPAQRARKPSHETASEREAFWIQVPCRPKETPKDPFVEPKTLKATGQARNPKILNPKNPNP